MKFSKFILIPIIIAFLALTIQIVDQLASGSMPVAGNVGFGWIAFIAWAMYFMAGCDIKGGQKVLFGYIAGIIASIAIMELGTALVGGLGFFAFPIAIFIVVVPCICLERVPLFDFIPALFVGAGTFFGFMSYVPSATYTNATITELTYCVIGLIYGWMTVVIRSRYEASVASSEDASELHTAN